MTPRARNFALFLLFFVSGFCGLAYQVVWLRLAYASFGIITPVLSVVVSVFMLGLALGSWLAGRWVGGLGRRLGRSAIELYAMAELVIAAGALAVPPLFDFSERLLLPLNDVGSASYLLTSAPLLGLSILPWCLAMGATYPLMLGFVREVEPGDTERFSFLYLANTVGAMAGVLVTAVVLIELLGLSGTLRACALANLAVAGSALAVGRAHPRPDPGASGREAPPPPGAAHAHGGRALWVLFSTGFCSLGLEVVWVRAFTPILGTRVYSFALLLFAYLLATWVGALVYRRQLAAGLGQVASTGTLLGALSVAAFLPVLFSDPRFNTAWLPALVSIAPLSGLLGYLTPKLVDEYARGTPRSAGRAYALNVLGSILGPLVAAYLLLPAMGPRLGMALLALPFLGLLALHARDDEPARRFRIASAMLAAGLLVCAVFVNVGFEEGPVGKSAQVRRDHTATVVSYGDGMEKELLVNGTGITKLTSVAKVMGHLPMAFLERKPESALVICFGMGTTFRSLVSWNVPTTAVELARAVVEAFPYYFDDARVHLETPGARVVIDDGRRFLQRTDRRWDVITIDPPPPLEAAGSSLLYSVEFLELVKRRLAPDGVLHHWVPTGSSLIHAAVTRSLASTFPHLRAFVGHRDLGIHFIASTEPFRTPTPGEFVVRMPLSARADLLEWEDTDATTPLAFARHVLSREFEPSLILHPDPRVVITDDRPFNEYFLLRSTLPGLGGPAPIGAGRPGRALRTGS